ncbi:MAG: SDR family oxidoreductase [Desulfobulbaceae bacterium]|uniref:SDR family oxidoreductase n=1 Tax=Candidatus Desulfatifera sulfidica TaxID=2841691 RepID=A0A8J6T9C1_9BACT|nr:SDR family oxidoreductase [Candidatus Desulfatifera sulfidica]
MEKEFVGKKVVVSGASRGIGRAISLAFLEQGATVLGIYGGNETAAQAMRDECSAAGDHLRLTRCDVSNATHVEELFRDIENEFSTIDVLINNAGIRRDKLLALMDVEDWQEVINVNLTGTFLMAKHAVLLMLKQKYGRIINITSPAASLGFQGQTNYSASKAGQMGLTRSLAKETAKKKITVNCVAPGFIDTDFLDGLNDSQLAEYKKMVPMRRFGRGDEVAAAVLFLASAGAAYITGSLLDVNGGL